MKKLIVDLDDTISRTKAGDYQNSLPNLPLIARLKQYRNDGFQIVICTARNMRTYGNNIGKINAHTLPIVIDWLDRHDVPYDEVYVGKPWCGFDGFYIDDKAIRPSEFVRYSYEEILDLLSDEKI